MKPVCIREEFQHNFSPHFYLGKDYHTSVTMTSPIGEATATGAAPARAVDMTAEDVLHGATAKDIEIIRSLLSDEKICRFGKYIGQKVLWNCDEFVDKVGFASKGNAFKSAIARDLVRFNVPYKDAVGLYDIDGMPIINPLPANTPLAGNLRMKVKFMGTLDILHWISAANTQRATEVREALWWMFLAADHKAWSKRLDEAEKMVSVFADHVLLSIMYVHKLA